MKRALLILALAAILVAAALSVARPSSGSRAESRYVVRAGDTLWSIAATHYGGDPREAIWEIEHRNHLGSSLLIAGQLLVLPAS